jgi:ATP-dependent Clp protease ATP-binding subunit ClpC
MNDDVHTRLKVLVERAVRPVRASVARKRQMREEMLAHLTAIYEEEIETHGDERIAFERAKLRYGDPGRLSQELQSSVPRWSAVQGFLQRMRLEPGESSLHFAAKIALATVLVNPIAVVGTLPIALLTGKWQGFASLFLFEVVSVTAAISAVFWFLLLLVGSKISRALYGSDSERSVRTGIYYCLASVLLFPMLVTLIYGGFWLPAPNSALLLACAIAPATPVLLVLMARVIADEVRPDEEWARLDIDT